MPPLLEACRHTDDVHDMVRKNDVDRLDPWIAATATSPIASFARGVVNDEATIQASVTHSWSNGQTEGQIIKFKLVKRQIFGRAKIDLPQARLIGAD